VCRGVDPVHFLLMSARSGLAPIGILSIATTVGEQALGVADLAAKYQTSEALIRKSLGGATVWTTSRELAELTADVARRCLTSAGVARADLIVWCESPGRDSVHVAEQLGLAPSTVNSHVIGCHRILVGIETARQAIERGEADHVLVLCVEVWRFPDGRRSFGQLAGDRLQDFFSDGGSAVLVGRCEREVLRAYASVTDGTAEAFYRIYQPGASLTAEEIAALEMEALHHTVTLGTRALTSALADAQLTRAALDHVILQQEPTAVRQFHVRRLGLNKKTLVEDESAVAHLGSSDVILAFERARSRGVFHAGQHVALVVRTPGSVAVTLIEA
jgi:3-oxoacyl-[acyl-carrier-protein] synthase III